MDTNWYQNLIDSTNIGRYKNLDGSTYRFNGSPAIFDQKERSSIMLSIKFLVDKNDYEELKEELLEVNEVEINRRFISDRDGNRHYYASLYFDISPEQEINVRLSLSDPRPSDEYALPVYDGDLNNILNTFFIRLEGDTFVTPINQGVELNGSSLNNLMTRGSINYHLRTKTETNMLLSLLNPDLHEEQIPSITGIDSLEWPLVELSFRMGLSVDQDNLIYDYEENKDGKEEVYGLMVEYIENLYKLLDYPIEIHQSNGGTRPKGERDKILQEVLDYLESDFFNGNKTIFLHLKNKDQYDIILEHVISGFIKRGEDHSVFKRHDFSDIGSLFNDNSFKEGYYMLTRGFFSLIDSEMISEEALNDVSEHSINVISNSYLDQSFPSKFTMLQEIIEEKRIPSSLQN